MQTSKLTILKKWCFDSHMFNEYQHGLQLGYGIKTQDNVPRSRRTVVDETGKLQKLQMHVPAGFSFIAGVKSTTSTAIG